MTTQKPSSGNKGLGMHWITDIKRLACYSRDGFACCYCGKGVEDGAQLTLDHLRPRDHGGSNKETNLVTACMACNSSRGNGSWKLFAAKSGADGITSEDIISHIERTRNRKLNIVAAKALIAARGGFTAAVQSERIAA